MKKKDKTVIYLGCLTALLLSTSALVVDEIKVDHTETLCTTTKFLNMIDKTGELGMKHQLSKAAGEKGVVEVKYVDDYTKTIAFQEKVTPTIKTSTKSEINVPVGYTMEIDEQGNIYAVRTIKTKEIIKPIIEIVNGEKKLTAPSGYKLEVDEDENVYAVKELSLQEKKELPVINKTISEVVVPEGYTLTKDENGNIYGRKITAMEKNFGQAILSTYKDGSTKTLLLNKLN